jgi:VanZ family protein
MRPASRWAPGVVWVAIIFIATSIPGSTLSPVPVFYGADKLVHVFMYGVLAVLLCRSANDVSRTPLQTTVRVLVGIAVLAAIDEVHQQWIPERAAEVADWLADVTGALTGATLWLTALRRRETIS